MAENKKIIQTVKIYGNKTNTSIQQRVAIPKDVATLLNTNPGDTMLLECDGEKIILKKV